jgi:hypothetical protein
VTTETALVSPISAARIADPLPLAWSRTHERFPI